MSKSKNQVIEINGKIICKYEPIKLKDDLRKQRFYIKSFAGEKYFITAFGEESISQLGNFDIDQPVIITAGKEVSNADGREFINYYLNEIKLNEDKANNEYFKIYLDYFHKNKIDCRLTCKEVEVIYQEMVSKLKIDRRRFDQAVEHMVKKYKNYIYFNLQSPKKFYSYLTAALKDLEESERLPI